MISPTENNQRMKFEASPEVDTQEKSKNKRRLVKFFAKIFFRNFSSELQNVFSSVFDSSVFDF